MDRLIKRLKLYALPEGALTDRRPDVVRPTDDDWWGDVLHDPRGRSRADITSIAADSAFADRRLDRQPETITVNCPCGERGTFTRTELVKALGPRTNVDWAARKVIDCGHRDKVANYCRAYVVR